MDRTKNGATLYPSGTYPRSVSADQVPVNKPFRLTPQMFVSPHGSESATVRITGPGIDFTKTYVNDPSAAVPIDVQFTYQNDPDSLLTATDTGAMTLWLEFEGTRSEDVLYTVVAQSTGTGGGSGSGSGGGSAGGEASSRGCSAAGAASPVLALGFFALLRRRARRNS
jgi:hypothetical protein